MTKDLTEYQAFLETKKPRAAWFGFDVEPDALHPRHFGFQRDIIVWALKRGRAALFLDTGLGKALSVDAQVFTPNGLKRMGDVAVGDEVIGSDGRATKVIGVYPQGVRPAYRVTFTDGASVVCDAEHLWAVRTKVQKYRQEPYRVKTLAQIMSEGLTEPSQQGWRHFIPVVRPVEFAERDLLLHPYLLGVLLGDGGLSQGTPMLSSPDEDLLGRCASLLPADCELYQQSKYDWSIRKTYRNGHVANPVTAALRGLGLMGGRSEHKFIPEAYKYASVPQRVELLRGLLDTDGHVRPADNNIEYCTVSPRLAEDVAFIVRSLGGTCRIRTKKTTGQLAYRMSVILPAGINPFWIERKASVYHDRPKYQPTRAIAAVEEVGECEMVCIKVDAADELFVVDGFIVTHNTAIQLEWGRHVAAYTGRKVLILTPLAVAHQFVTEAGRLDMQAAYVRSQEAADASDAQVIVTNYEMLKHFDPTKFAGVSLDESGILKNFTGKTRQELTAAFRETPYRLCATATPAPNDYLELGNHCDFLGVMPANEMIMRWFINDTMSAGNYRLKGHAAKDYWAWVASWAACVSKPSDLGYSDEGYDLPPLRIHQHRVEVDHARAQEHGQLFLSSNLSATAMWKDKRATLADRCRRVAEVVAAQPDEVWAVWCDTNEEADLLLTLLPAAETVEVRGSQSVAEKERKLAQFASGERRILITKADITGSGLNWQFCAHTAVTGVTYSFERMYQLIRRFYRFGQEREVNVHLIVSETEDDILATVRHKESQHREMQAAMTGAMRESGLLADRKDTLIKYNPTMPMRLPSWLRSKVAA